MTPETLVSVATLIALFILSAAFLLTVRRVVIGPTLPDRVIALDTLVGIAIGFIVVIAVRTGFNLYIDIAIALCLVGFLATVAFARFILSRTPDGKSRRRETLDGTDVLPSKHIGSSRHKDRKKIRSQPKESPRKGKRK